MIHTKQIEGIFATYVAREMAGRHVIGLLELQEMIKRAFDSSGYELTLRKTAMQVQDERNAWLLPIRAEYERMIAELRFDLDKRNAFLNGSVWFYQGDGNDRLESLTCPVMIQPDALLALLTKIDKADALYDSAYVAGLGAGYNLGVVEDNAGLQRAIKARAGYLKVLKEKRTASPAHFRQTPGNSMSGMYVYRDSGPLETADH